MLRDQLQQEFKSYFYNQLITTRFQLGLTQAETAHLLAMDTRSYIELDHGKNSCCALTLALFLTRLCQDPVQFLNDLQITFENILLNTNIK